MKTAVIAGATGLVGSHLCDLIATEPDFDRVVALTRRPLDFSSPKLVEQRVEFNRLADADLGSVDAAFCTLGTTIKTAGSEEAFRAVDLGYVESFAQIAKNAGARLFALLTSVGADPASSNFYLHVKGEVEKAVGSIGFESLYCFRPSFLIGSRQEERTGERVGIAIAQTFRFVFVGPLGKYHAIPAATVAAGMRGAARQASAGCHVCHYDEILALARIH